MKLILGFLLALTFLQVILNSTVSEKVNISNIKHVENRFDSKVESLTYCGKNKQIMFLKTEKKTIFKSEDRGFTIKKINNLFTLSASTELIDNQSVDHISSIVESKADENTLYFLGDNGFLWVTDNCGVTFKAINLDRPIQQLHPHPTEKNWLLATSYTICSDFKDEPCRIYKEIYLSKNGGSFWEFLTNYVEQVGWGINEQNFSKELDGNELKTKDDLNKSNIPKERIFVTLNLKGRGTQKSEGWNYKIDFIYSDDFFKTTKIGIYKGNKFLLTGKYLFIAQLVDQELQEVALHVADSRSSFLNFNQCEIDSHKILFTNENILKNNSFTFLDTSENSVFISIVPASLKFILGNIYISDANGIKFSLSLEYNVHSKKLGKSDFSKAAGLEGVYISNVINKNYIEENFEELFAQNNDTNDNYINQSNVFEKNLENLINSHGKFIQTFITFNKGGSWNRLKAPMYYSKGILNYCEEDIEGLSTCYLNLYGISSDYPPYYSVDSAIGIILSNGSIGEYLSQSEEDINTYISNDGGRTFREVRKGIYIYEIGDHGGLIVMTLANKATNILIYSLDEGFTWDEYIFSDNLIRVENILIENTSSTQYFIIYGDYLEKKRKIDVTITVDFTNITRKCEGMDSPNSNNSDYETWSPGDFQLSIKSLITVNEKQNINKENCLMGKQMIYTRKKLTSKCFNSGNTIKKTIASICKCTDKDYECDLGYSRDVGLDSITTSHCVKTNYNKELDDFQLFEILNSCVGYYALSDGYRKVPGNQCSGGVNHDPTFIPCSNQAIFSSFGVILFIVLSIILVILLYLAFNNNFVNNPTEIRNIFSKTKKERSNFEPGVNLGKFYHQNSLRNESFEREEDNSLVS